MMPIRLDNLVFFGTPEFAVPTLDALVTAGRPPALVVSQPARPAGRGRRLAEPPVAARARDLELPLVQPRKVREAGFLERLAELEPSVGVVVAFGQIFPSALLELPEHGCINLHASLLPRHRGAAPIQAAIAAGDSRTGVTAMQMAEGLDTGPILRMIEVEIGPEETAPELAARLAAAGAALVVETLASLAARTLETRPQPAAGVSHAPRVSREDGRVEWGMPAKAIYDRWRAYQPWPGISVEFRGEALKILEAALSGTAAREPAGTILGLRAGRLEVACGDGSALDIARLQRAGRKPLSGKEFLNGERLAIGDRLD